MILTIGNSGTPNAKGIRKEGFTLIEILVTMTILSVGIVAIFKTYLISLDQINHLTYRLYATTILDNRISTTERMLRAFQALPIDLQHTEKVDLGHKTVNFEQELNISKVEDFLNVFEIDVTLKWMENDHQKQLSRSGYISNFSLEL